MSDQKQQVQTEKESGARPAGGELWLFHWTTHAARGRKPLRVTVAAQSIEDARRRALGTIRRMPFSYAGAAHNLRRRVKACTPGQECPAEEARILSKGEMVFAPLPQAQPQAEEKIKNQS